MTDVSISNVSPDVVISGDVSVVADFEIEVIQEPTQGPPGPPGPAGPPGPVGSDGPSGTRGSLWYVGSGPPPTYISGQLANDQYLNELTSDIYTLQSTGTWLLTGNIEGYPDAPSDGSDYGRKNGAWDRVAGIASPSFTGVPLAPTAAPGTNTMQLATTAFVGAAVTGIGVPPPSSTLPAMDGTAAIGTGTNYARNDHVHPSDSSRAPVASPTLTGIPAAPTATPGNTTTQIATTAFVGTAITNANVPAPSSTTPGMDGTAAVGVGTTYARADHIHPSDTSRAPVASPTFTGTPAAPTATAGTATTQLATTAFVGSAITTAAVPAPSTTTPAMDGTAAIGTGTNYARNDHVHPSDTSRAPLASPTFTGTPAAPTPAANDNTTKVATTAFVLGQAGTATPLMNGVAAVGTSLLYTRQDHIHPSDTSKLSDAAGSIANDGQTYARKNNAWATIPAAILYRSYLAGLQLSTPGSSATFSVSAGMATDTTDADMLTLAASISKTTATWAVGSGVGGLDTGAIAANTWYYVYLIKRTDTQVVDVLCSASSTTPTLPASYTLSRRLGAMKTNASSQWLGFTQIGDTFLWNIVSQDYNNYTGLGTGVTNLVLGVPPNLPVRALFHAVYSNSGAPPQFCLLCNPYTSSNSSNTPPGNANLSIGAAGGFAAGDFQIMVSNAYIQASCMSATGNSIYILTYGWIDRRGRDS